MFLILLTKGERRVKITRTVIARNVILKKMIEVFILQYDYAKLEL